MKSYTDLEQSKKLAEILPLESADMFFADGERPAIWNNKDAGLDDEDIPCWSLAALLNILPHCIDEGYDLTLGKLTNNKGWYVVYDDIDHFVYIYITKSNLIDACVEMILKLKEKDLL